MILESPVTILVRRRAALGDVILATSVINRLAELYAGNCVIDVVTELPIAFDNNPHVRNVFHPEKIPASKYDVYYNLDDTYEINPDTHFVDSYHYRVFGSIDPAKSTTELFVDDEQATVVDGFVGAINGDYICVHIRNWHWDLKNIKTEVWLDVLGKLKVSHPELKIVCVGGKTDGYFSAEGDTTFIDAREKFTPGQLGYLMESAKCFVGIDSAPFHIAGASSTHIVALLSHMYPEKVLPYRNGVMGDNCTVIQASVPCVGCHSRQQRPVRQIVCERTDFACNQLWDTQAIADAIIKTL